MINILNQFNEKITTLTENYLKNLIFSKGISNFTEDLVAEFANFGTNLTQYLIENIENVVFQLDERKALFSSIKKDSRSIVSIFGEITYKRRYYEEKDGNKIYLTDKIIGIKSNKRLLENVRERLIDSAIDTSYEYAGEHAAYGVKISRQEVKNEIEELNLEQSFYPENIDKRKSENIYIIADEDHVHLQKGGIEEPRIIIVYDNILEKGKRIELQNKRHIGGIYKNRIEDLWDEVAMYIENTYDIDYIKNIFISGDGASWIKTGSKWINKSINILDRFHMVKAVNAIAGKDNTKGKIKLFKSIAKLDFEKFKEYCYEILSEEMNQSIRFNKEKLMNYILNNKKGIENYYNYKEYLHGCSAEGHVSHVYSDRMSSRPMGWKTQNVNNMSKLRLLKADNISVKTILEKQEKIIDINEYKIIKEKTKRKININFKPVSLPIMTFGEHEEKEFFKSLLEIKAI